MTHLFRYFLIKVPATLVAKILCLIILSSTLCLGEWSWAVLQNMFVLKQIRTVVRSSVIFDFDLQFNMTARLNTVIAKCIRAITVSFIHHFNVLGRAKYLVKGVTRIILSTEDSLESSVNPLHLIV